MGTGARWQQLQPVGMVALREKSGGKLRLLQVLEKVTVNS